MSRTTSQDALDPGSIVTPEAFEISPELLGMPLAGPLGRPFAIHDEIARTVAVLDGAERVPGPWTWDLTGESR